MYTYTIVYIYYIYSDPQYCNELDLGICSHQYEYDLTVRYATVYRLEHIYKTQVKNNLRNFKIFIYYYEPYF